jgi:hypothetical protein
MPATTKLSQPKAPKRAKPQPVVVIKLPRQSRIINTFRAVQAALRSYRAERYRPVKPVAPVGPSLVERSAHLGATSMSAAARGFGQAASSSAVATQRAGSALSRSLVALLRPVFGRAARQRMGRLVAGILLLVLAFISAVVRSAVSLMQAALLLASMLLTGALQFVLGVINLVQSLLRMVWVGLTIAAEYVQILIILAVRLTIAGVIIGAIYAMRAWRWAVPYMDRVDAWVLARLGRHEPSQIFITIAREAIQTIVHWYRRVRAYFGKPASQH